MTRALVIDSSSRTLGSVTRTLTQKFIAGFSQKYGEESVVYRDLVKSSVPHLSADTIEGFFSLQPTYRAKRATVLSDLLVDEFLQAEVICIGVAVYNFNIPSSLKAYIDQIVRIGKTFRKQGDGQLEGLCQNKKLIILYSMGGMYQDTEMDFIKPYFKALAGFIGISDVEFIAIEGTSRSGFKLEEHIEESTMRIETLLESENSEVEHA